MLPIFTYLYYAGLFVCGAQGYQIAGGWCPQVAVASHGGGLLRDLLVLNCEPACLSLETFKEMWFVWAGALFQARYGTRHWFNVVKFLLDPFACGVFIIIGAAAAQNQGCSFVLVALCGAITALGGSLFLKLLTGAQFREALSLNIEYRLIVVATAGLYSVWTYNKNSSFEIQLSTILIVGFSNIMISAPFQYILRKLMEQQVLIQPAIPIVILLRCWLRDVYTPYRALKAGTRPPQPQPWHRVSFHLRQPA